jgi:hypothetical protein
MLFIYGLFNVSEPQVYSVEWLSDVYNELERMWKEVAMA